jgi:hypothetical protein
VDPEALRRRAETADAGSIERALWIVALVQSLLDRRVVLIGGAAQNLYTGEYRPTDIDLAAPGVGRADFELLGSSGFVDRGPGHRHVELHLRQEDAPELIEFPADLSDIDATDEIALADDVTIEVITLPALFVDRLIQATDGTSVTFDDAVALLVATYGDVDWGAVQRLVTDRTAEPMLSDLPTVLRRVRSAAEQALR